MGEYVPLCAMWQDRQAIYSPDGLPVVWDRAALPLSFILQLDEGQEPYAAAAREAAQMWNREVGFTVFREVKDVTEARVFVTTGSATDAGAAATTHSGDVVPESATVQLRSIGSIDEAVWATVHELGHVLGLADGDSGCMGPMPAEFDASKQWCLPRDREVDYLRAVYHR
jgi:hypothetical protein